MSLDRIDRLIGEKISVARLAQRLTLDELGAQTGIASKCLKGYESGLLRFSGRDLVRVCKALKVDLSTLLPEPELQTPATDPSDALRQVIIQRVVVCNDAAILKNIANMLGDRDA